MPNWIERLLADIADLITRTKGLDDIHDDLVAVEVSQVAYAGTVTGVVAAPKFQCSGLVGHGDDYFKDFWAYVVWDAAGGGAQPQGQRLECTGYDSAGGDFTVAAFAPNVIAAGDKVLLIHPSLAYMLNLTPTRAGYLDELDFDLQGALSTIAGYLDTEVGAIITLLDTTGVVRGARTTAAKREAGVLQIFQKTWDGRFGSGAGSDALFTVNAQDIIVEKLIVKMTSVDLTDDDWDGISVEDDYATTPHVFIDATAGAKANLTINAQLAWTGAVLVDAGQAIQATAIADDANEDALITVYIMFRAVADGGFVT